MRVLFVGATAVATIAAMFTLACSRPPADPLQLEPNRLTVDNRTSEDWKNVEIWLNRSYRVTTPSIPAGGRFQAPLDAFVSGFGRRFDFRKMQITDLRLDAKRPDGKPLELKKQFTASGLAGVFQGLEKR